MRYVELTEARVAEKIKRDPRLLKMLVIAMKHDNTLPPNLVAQLGHRVVPEAAAQAWSDLLDKSLSNTTYGDLSADGKFDDWLTRLYINGAANFEDISGEAADTLGAWKALSLRGALAPRDQDFNKFTSIHQLQKVMRDRQYQEKLSNIRDEAKMEKLKRDAKMVVILDNERFNVAVPMNYGACYTRDRYAGYQPNFCTSGSSGAHWFQNYAPRGMIVNIQDKSNLGNEWGKWQFHASTNQLVNANQDRRHDIEWNDAKFAELFPGLMPQIIAGIQAHAQQIHDLSKIVTPEGYDIAREIEMIRRKYPISTASRAAATAQTAQAPEQGQPTG